MATQVNSTVTAQVIAGLWPGKDSSTKSNTTSESSQNRQKDHLDRKKRPQTYKHASAVHKEGKISCLTQGQEGYPSFVGFRNLMVLVILVSNFRLMIENWRKYGVLLCLSCHDYRRQDVTYGAILFSLVPSHLFVSYLIELIAAQEVKGVIGRAKKKSEHASQTELYSQRTKFTPTWHLIALAHGINATLNLCVASYVVYYHIYHPGIGTICELHAVIVWLKVCSYALTNRDLRHALLIQAPSSSIPELYKSCPYPQNISLGNLSYFWFAPTLIYQPLYPRTSHIRWTFVLKRAGEIVTLGIAIWIASAQFAVPLLNNSLPIISNLDFMSILERVLKLSSISLFCWLAGFYATFQSFLNLLAELMTFADREFYKDFWNSTSIASYWKSWNIPVSSFMKRHIYLPLVARGVRPKVAQVLVFVFSAVLHEMLVGIPTHNIIGVAFMGMMLQIPLIALTDAVQKITHFGPTMGNMIFWVSFCLVGQPLAALLYFFAWQAKYGSVSLRRTEKAAL